MILLPLRSVAPDPAMMSTTGTGFGWDGRTSVPTMFPWEVERAISEPSDDGGEDAGDCGDDDEGDDDDGLVVPDDAGGGG